MKIGVFDSGIGGLTILKYLINDNNYKEFIYYADTFNLPYGSKTKEELIDISTQIIRFFEEKQVDKIVIACGTCSSISDELRKITRIPIIDIITPTVEYLKDKYKYVSLIATESTIKNGIFEKQLEQAGIKVKTIGCPSFVPFIEKQSKIIDLSVLDETKDTECIILGCTHYPLIKDIIEEYTNINTFDMGASLNISPSTNINSRIDIYVSGKLNIKEEEIFNIINKEFNIKYLQKDEK